MISNYLRKSKAVSATSVYFECLPYRVNQETGIVDYNELEKTAVSFKPALIIAGGSAYLRDWDYGKFRASVALDRNEDLQNRLIELTKESDRGNILSLSCANCTQDKPMKKRRLSLTVIS